MSVRAMAIVWSSAPTVDTSELLLLLAMADRASDDGISWPQLSELSKKTRLSERHVIRIIQKLVGAGAIQIRKVQRGRKRISVYRLNLPSLAPPDYDRLPFVVSPPFDDMTPSHVTPSHVDQRRHDTGGSDGMTPRVRVPSNHQEKHQKTIAPAERARDELWDALTAQFGEAGTHGAKSLRGKIVKSLREAGATEAEIRTRAIRYARVMPPGTLLTETALEKHWPLLASPEIKTPPCEECGVGGGLHVAGCTRVAV